MPLGSKFAKEKLGPPKKFLFLGPQGTGKTMMVRILQTECNAMVFDISPSNILEKCEDVGACKRLFWLVWRLSHEYDPAIILMDEIDMIYPKKKITKEGKRYYTS
jgi:ATP-dependent 26S proteasome regulatory subunit